LVKSASAPTLNNLAALKAQQVIKNRGLALVRALGNGEHKIAFTQHFVLFLEYPLLGASIEVAGVGF
jgi:hypothetical protein